MSFANLPSQLVAIFLGWAFTLFLQHKANVRAESIRKKDKIIDRIDKLVDWAEKHSAEGGSDVEEIYSAMVTQIEIRTINLNRLLRAHSVSAESVALIRAIDILDTERSGEPLKQLRLAAVGLAEDLEVACDARYFSRDPISVKLNRYIYEMAGVAVGVLALLFLFTLFYGIRSALH